MLGDVDSSNKAHSVMGPECWSCGHRLRWHDPGQCKWPPHKCPCRGFDDDSVPPIFAVLWHCLVRRHRIEDRVTTFADQYGERRERTIRCSCGKRWR